MAVYEVVGPDGATYQVEGPEGATDAQIIAAVQQQIDEEDRAKSLQELETAQSEYAALFAQPEAPDEEGFFETIGKGLVEGYGGTLETAGVGAAAILDEESELAARKIIQELGEAAKFETADRDSIEYLIASGLGSFGAILTPAALALAAPFSATAAAIVGTGGAAALGVAAGAGEASERARAAGATEEERSAATLRGAAIGSLEVLPLSRILKIPGVSELADRLGGEVVETIGQRIQSAAVSGGAEAAQEVTAGILQNLNEMGYNPEKELLDAGLIDEAIAGGGAGAILQAVVDTFTKGRARGAPTPSEPTQGELFPGEDLGTAPEAPAPDQGELFPDADLGTAPERPDDRQLDLFGAPTIAEEEAVQQELFPRIDQAEEERVRAEAREREALRAAERGDEDAFEQPDLFALEQEQERRRLGPEELRRPDQFMDTLEEAVAEEGAPTQERDLLTLIEEETQLAEMQAQEDAQKAEQQRVRAESELETIGAAQEGARARQTEQRRTKILQDVIEQTPTRQEGTLSRAFSRALEAEGITDTTPSDTELGTIRRAIDIQRAEAPTAPEPEVVESAPEATQLEEMESRIPERRERGPEQPSLPGFGRQRRPAAEPSDVGIAPEPREITKELMDDLQIAQSAPIRKRIEGKDLNDPAVREDLTKFANNQKVGQQTRLNVSRMLEGTPDEQLELFTPTRGRGRGRPSAAPTVEPTPDRAGVEDSGPSVATFAAPTGDAERVAAPRPERLERPERRALLPDVREGGEPAALTREEIERRAMTPQQVFERLATERAKKAAPKKAASKQVTKKAPTQARTAAEVTAPAKKAAAKKAAPKREAVAKKPAPKTKRERIQEELDSVWESDMERQAAGTIDFAAPNTAQFKDDPTTGDDRAKILELLNSAQKARDDVGKAAQTYFSKMQRPVDALYMAVYDFVYNDPAYFKTTDEMVTGRQFRATKDMDQNTVDFFRGTGRANAERTLKWAKENLSPEANKFIEQQLKKEAAERARIARLTSGDRVAEARAKQEQLERQNRAFERKLEKERRKDAVAEYNAILEEESQYDDPLLGGDLLKLLMRTDSVVNLDTPVHQAVRSALQNGNLKAALQALSVTGTSPRIRQIAAKLSGVVGDTKIEVVKVLLDDAGNPVAGMFDPATNTIKLDADSGVNAHVILHEMTHAATSATLANKSHPVTKKLTKLFNEVKDQLGTFYGSQSVDEFVSEAFSNPEFQKILAGINPKGEQFSALERFINTVSNMLRRLMGMDTKPLGSAQVDVDEMIDAIISPSPESRDAGALFMMSTPDSVKNIMRNMGAIQKTFSKPMTPEARQRFGDLAVDFLASSTDFARRLLLGVLGTKSLGDVSMRNGFGDVGVRLHKTIEKQRGAIQESDKEVRAFIDNVFVPWADRNPEAKTALDRLIYSDEYGATIYQVDPAKPRSAYEGRTDDSGNDLAKIWDAQRRDWNRLGADGHRVYNGMRKVYADQYQKLKKVIYGEIDDLMKDNPDAARRLKNEVYAKLFEAGTLDVYFPLLRQGHYKLTYAMKDPKSPREAYVVRMFDTKRERDRVMKEVESDPDVVINSVETNDGDMQVKDYRNAPPTSFVGDTLKTLTANGVDPNVQAQIMRLFIDALPETSFAKSLQKRKGTPGYIQDSLVGLKTKAYDIGRQAVRLEYAAKLRMLEDEIRGIKEPKRDRLKLFESLKNRKGVRWAKDQLTASFEDNKKELVGRAKFAREGAENKGLERYFKTANQGAFIYTIGFNISSAMVNLSQIPLFAYPYMSAKHGVKDAGAAIARASQFAKIVITPTLPKFENGKLRAGQRDQIDDYYNVDDDGNYTVRTDLDLSTEEINQLKRMATMVKTASERGYLGRSYLQDALGLEEGGRQAQGNKAQQYLDAISTASAFAFNAVERFNRQTIMFANYDLILDRLTKDARYFSETQGKYIDTNTLSRTQKEELAANEALYQTEQLNGGMVLETAPRLSQQGIGRVALMYKSYGINMYYTMLKSASRMLDATVDPEMRKQAMKELIAVHGSALLFAGVHGVPLYGIFTMIADLILDDEEDDADTIVRKYIGEGWFKGPINYVTGVDVASRVRLTDLVFQENRYNSNPSLEEGIGYYLGGPALSTGKRLLRGVTDLKEGEVERGVENLMPPAFANAYKSTFGRYAREGGAYTRRGDPIYDDITTGELIGQMFGFAPTGYTFEQERNQATKRVDRNVNERRTKLLRKLYIATRMRDYDGRKEAMDEIRKFNNRYRGTGAMISADAVRRSLRQHARTSAQMHNGITISPAMRRALIESRNEWNQ